MPTVYHKNIQNAIIEFIQKQGIKKVYTGENRTLSIVDG